MEEEPLLTGNINRSSGDYGSHEDSVASTGKSDSDTEEGKLCVQQTELKYVLCLYITFYFTTIVLYTLPPQATKY